MTNGVKRLCWCLLGSATVAAALWLGNDAQGGGTISPKGEPAGFKAGLSERYAVWYGKNGWHLRTTTAKTLNAFKGVITVTGGTFASAYSYKLEKSGKLADHWSLDMPDKQRLAFNFKTDKGVDGITFKFSPNATKVTFELYVNEAHQPKLVYIGSAGAHPSAIPFSFPATPK